MKFILLAIAILTAMCFNPCYPQTKPTLPDSVAVRDTFRITSNSDNTEPQQQVVMEDSNTEAAKAAQPEIPVYRIVPDSTSKTYSLDKSFAYANDSAYWTAKPVSNKMSFTDKIFAFFSTVWFRALVYVLLAAILLFALYKIVVENKLYLFYSKPKLTAQTQTSGQEPENVNLDKKIQEAVSRQDYRFAIRFMFLKALQVADQRGMIHFQSKATNLDYLAQVQDHKQGEVFRLLTKSYEQVWYGKFPVSENRFQYLSLQFQNFYNSSGI